MKSLNKKIVFTAVFALVLSACSDDKDDKVVLPAQALVQTTAPDYSSSEVVAVDVENEQVSTGYYVKDASDYNIISYEDSVYHLGRYNIDTITKYSADSLESEIWSYSTQDNEDSTPRNLYTIAFSSSTNAYIVRYGSDKIWQVNPSAQVVENFKTGELDLSAYVENNSLNTPRPAAAVVHNNKLFIAMQRLDDNWSTQTAYIAVFDVTTGEEIETNANADDAVKGIPLAGLNPSESSLFIFGDELFVTTNDSYASADKANSKIEAIDTNSYSLRTIISANELTTQAGASISRSVIVSDEQGYFVATAAAYEPSYHEISSVYQFNPTTGAITATNVAGSGEEDINYLALDDNGYLWLSVGSAATPGIDVINTNTNEKHVERLLTDLNPGKIAFLK